MEKRVVDRIAVVLAPEVRHTEHDRIAAVNRVILQESHQLHTCFQAVSASIAETNPHIAITGFPL